MPTNVFTDNKRAGLQIQLQRDYELLAAERKSPQEIYNTLLARVRYNLSFPYSGLYDLSPEDQVKVYMLLNNLFQTYPQYLQTESPPQVEYTYVYIQMPETDFGSYRDNCYCPTNDFLFTWILLDTVGYFEVSTVPLSSQPRLWH